LSKMQQGSVIYTFTLLLHRLLWTIYISYPFNCSWFIYNTSLFCA